MNPGGSLAARCFSVYRNRVGLDSAFRPLRLLTWLVHARSEYRRLWEEELRDGRDQRGNLV